MTTSKKPNRSFKVKATKGHEQPSPVKARKPGVPTKGKNLVAQREASAKKGAARAAAARPKKD